MPSEDQHLINEAKKIVHALGKMFCPFCEVVLHDLRDPENAIVAIENNFSGRKIGSSAAGLALARSVDKKFPDVLQNYQNTLPNGRIVKTTVIGIKNRAGNYVAAIGINFDVTQFSSFRALIDNFVVFQDIAITEHGQVRSVEQIKKIITQFAAEKNTTPIGLDRREKKELVDKLKREGWLEIKNAVPTVANILGVTRASIYNYQK